MTPEQRQRSNLMYEVHLESYMYYHWVDLWKWEVKKEKEK